MSDSETTTLRAGDAVVSVFPAFGDRIGQITVAGQPLLIDVADSERRPLNWGSYPMAPWVGRIRAGRFTFDGVEREMAINHHDTPEPGRAHAMHGLVFDRPWPQPIDDVSGTSSTATRDLEWEFGGTVTQAIDLAPDRLTVTLIVESTGRRFPAEVGWHPWFLRPDRLDFRPSAMYERDRFGIPTGALIEPSPRPWDDCFLNTEPVVLRYDRAMAPQVTVASAAEHWVVFDDQPHGICVEPQSGPPDAFNMTPHVVEPGRALQLSMTISW